MPPHEPPPSSASSDVTRPAPTLARCPPKMAAPSAPAAVDFATLRMQKLQAIAGQHELRTDWVVKLRQLEGFGGCPPRAGAVQQRPTAPHREATLCPVPTTAVSAAAAAPRCQWHWHGLALQARAARFPRHAALVASPLPRSLPLPLLALASRGSADGWSRKAHDSKVRAKVSE